MAESLRPLRSDEFTDQQQAAFFHARERRKSLAGIPELFRTSQLFGDGVMAALFNPAQKFPDRLTPITFKTAIRIADNVAVRSGNILDLSDAISGGAALWVENNTVTFAAGSLVAAEIVTAVFDNGAQLPAGLEAEIVVACIPGQGRARIWLNGREAARAESSGGDLGTIGFRAGTDGSFAQAANGPSRPGAIGTAPANFEVIEPLSVYVGQKPRHFV